MRSVSFWGKFTSGSRIDLLKLPNSWSTAVILRDSIAVAVAVAVRTRPRAIPLAMITTIKSINRFPLLSYMGVGSASRPFGAPKLRYNKDFTSRKNKAIQTKHILLRYDIAFLKRV